MNELNNDNRFDIDLKFGNVFEEELRDALVGRFAIEVKTERGRWKDTGNIFVEYESRGKKSGISVTQAKYYSVCLAHDDFISQSFFLLDMSQFKTWLRTEIKANKIKSVMGGDDNTSKGYLVPICRLHEVFYV